MAGVVGFRMVLSGAVWSGEARQARQGMFRRGKVRRGLAGVVRCGAVGYDMAGRGWIGWEVLK